MRRIVLLVTMMALMSVVATGVARTIAINGTNAPDRLKGTNRADNINGRSGDDILNGRGGNDIWLKGGDGNDICRGQDGNDLMDCGRGNDTLRGGICNDGPLYGSLGRDTLRGGTGDDFLNGKEHRDVFYGEDGIDNLNGLGDDTLYGEEDRDVIAGHAGDEPEVMEVPDDLAGWLQHHPYLKTGKPEPITVGGVKGVEFDVVAAAPEEHSSICGTDCIDVFKQKHGHRVILFEGDKIHFVILEDVKGDTVTIDYGGLASDFDKVAPQAQKLVDSVHWGGS